MKRKLWQPYEDEIMRKEYPNTHAGEIAKKLDRSPRSIWNRAKTLSLRKDPEWVKENSRQNMQKPNHGAHKTRFKKGQPAHNKGKRMPKHIYEKAAHTFFKKGDLPHNTLHDGAISIRTKKGFPYYYIRVAQAKWVPLHRFIWETHNGPVPEGMIVVFKDGNWKRCCIDNLELISREDNMKRNSLHNYPEDITKTIQMLGVLKRAINNKLKSEEDEQKQNEGPERSPVRNH